MRLGQRNAEVITNMGGKEVRFSIKASRKAMDTLSGSIYANTIAAVLRETACNAADAHAAAGKADVPIRVHLPTEAEPVLSVQDWGIGLDADALETLYTTYFESLSSESDVATGHFGLGSKSPFAYQDSFTVTATKDGVMRIYQAYRDSDNQPCVRRVRALETAAANGVRIDIPVNAEDIDAFHREATRVFAAFRVCPHLNVGTVAENIRKMRELAQATLVDEGQGWQIFSAAGHRSDMAFLLPGGSRDYGDYQKLENITSALTLNAHCSVVMLGDVAYPLEWDKIKGGRNDFSGAIGVNLDTIGAGLMLRLDLATQALDLQPSRESLQYTDLTCRVLRRALQRLLAEKRERYERAVAGKTRWEAWIQAGRQFAHMRWAAQALGIRAATRFSLPDWHVPAEALARISVHKIRWSALSGADGESARLHPKSQKRVDWYIRSDRPIFVYVQDGGFAPRRRIAHDLATRMGAGGKKPGEAFALVMRIAKGEKASMRALEAQVIEALGSPDFRRTSELEEPKAVTEAKRARARSPASASPVVAVMSQAVFIDPQMTWQSEGWQGCASRLVGADKAMDAAMREAIERGEADVPVVALYRGRLATFAAPSLPGWCDTWRLEKELGQRMPWMKKLCIDSMESLLCLIRLLYPAQPILCATSKNRRHIERMGSVVHPAQWLCDRLDTMDWSSPVGRCARRLMHRGLRKTLFSEYVMEQAYVKDIKWAMNAARVGEAEGGGWKAVRRGVERQLGALPTVLRDFERQRTRVLALLSINARKSARRYNNQQGCFVSNRLSYPQRASLNKSLHAQQMEQLLCQLITLGQRLPTCRIGEGNALMSGTFAALRARYHAPGEAFASRYPLLDPNMHLNDFCERRPAAAAHYITMIERS